MKKLSLLFVLFLCLTGAFGQRFVQYSEDSTRIRYATFMETETRDMAPDVFFTNFLGLDSPNRFVPTDTMYSPDSAYTYIKYRQQYGGYEAEGAVVTLTYHNHSIIRFNGYYIPAHNLLLRDFFSEEDAITAYKQYYRSLNDSCDYFVSKLVTYTPESKQAQLCFQVQSTDSLLYGKILYLSTNDLSYVREGRIPGAGFNATFCTMYNGVQQGFDWTLVGTNVHWLKDTAAAVQVLQLGYNQYFGNIDGGESPIFNNSSYWCNNSYPQYILDAYWSATLFSNYLQNRFHYPKHYFQRFWNNITNTYIVYDTLTNIYIATNTHYGQTFWAKIKYRPFYPGRDPPQYNLNNIIVIGTPNSSHNPKASIDEVVHEYAHIFSFQNWYYVSMFPSSADDALAEACADIWAAVITSQVYPNDEDKIWKIGEDIVLSTSGYTCVRNLAKPADIYAETPMFANNCQNTSGTAYEMSGVISHWFYLLTHGFSGVGCDGMCYNFPAIPIDSAAKLLFCCETDGYFMNGMTYGNICQATLDACENFSNPGTIMRSVLGAWNMLGVKPLSTGIGQFGLAYSSLNDAAYTVNENLVVDSSRTLTIKGDVYLCDTCSIIIQPGSKLVVDGGTLTSACPNEMWQGIEVVGDRTKRQLPQYQGTVELRNGAVIENAWCGIRTGLKADSVCFATTGGIIIADSATFKNNRQAVVINSYAGISPSGAIADNQCLFEKCTFVVDANNLFAANNTAFAEHVRLWDVKWVKFLGCHFRNEVNNSLVYNGRGIYASDAGMKLDVKCADDNLVMPGYCGCPPSYSDSCSFTGFVNAVKVIAGHNPYAVEVNRVKFSNNETGLSVNGNNYATITRNSFDLRNALYASSNIGLRLDNCTGYKVEANDFRKKTYSQQLVSTGIYVNNSGSTSNLFHLNNFYNLNYGIKAAGNNGGKTGGLQFTCNDFSGCSIDFYVELGATVASSIGSLTLGADNVFQNTLVSSLYNAGVQPICYYYSLGSNHAPYNPVNITAMTTKNANSCASTLCNNGGPVYPLLLAGFQSGMNAYTTALAGNTDTDGMGNADGAGVETQDFASLQQALSETYYTAVRTLMADSLLDLAALEQWHTAAQPIADPYSLTETRFCEGYAEPFAADVDDAEMANYAEFHAMKLVLRNNVADNDGSVETCHGASLQDGHINWYALTPAQIAQLQTIAERNTGRASVLAKGVLCFFFDICYDDEDQLAEDNGDVDGETRAKRTAVNVAADAALAVYPNPTDDLLHIELTGGKIANVALYDLQGRMVTGAGAYAGAPKPGTTATMNMRNVPAGVYLLRVTDADGKEYHRKVVKR